MAGGSAADHMEEVDSLLMVQELAGNPQLAGVRQRAGDPQLAGNPHLAGDVRLAGDTQLASDMRQAGNTQSAGGARLSGDPLLADGERPCVAGLPSASTVPSTEPALVAEPLLTAESRPVVEALAVAESVPEDVHLETGASGASPRTDAAPLLDEYLTEEYLLLERRLLEEDSVPTDASAQTDEDMQMDGSEAAEAELLLPAAEPVAEPAAVPAAEVAAESAAAPATIPTASALVCLCTDFFPATDDPDIEKDRWMTVRTFISAMLAEPVINVFGGCELIDVEVLARALIDVVPSAVWIQLAPAVTPVVFVWQFLLLVRDAMDESPSLCQAVGELLLFCINAEEQTMPLWEAKAGRAAKEYRKMWASGDAGTYKAWLSSLGVEPAVSNVVPGAASKVRVQEQANEERTGQVWPGREVLRAFPEDSTAERQRAKAAEKRKEDKPKDKDPKKAWDYDDCRHDYPVSVLRAPGVITFMCACGYIIGFELLRETESPAHAVAALVQRFKTMPRVIYFDTACQAQRNALRRVPWMMDGVCTAWFIDRFHRCNHKCSPVFNADQFPHLTRGHDTSGAERQHSIKKRSKNSLSYMTQRRFIVRSRFIAAHNNIRVSQRRQAAASAEKTRKKGEPKSSVEIQHQPVEAYYHHFIVSQCELGDTCPCRNEVEREGTVGLERKA